LGLEAPTVDERLAEETQGRVLACLAVWWILKTGLPLTALIPRRYSLKSTLFSNKHEDKLAACFAAFGPDPATEAGVQQRI
jgi:hypothetical protein